MTPRHPWFHKHHQLRSCTAGNPGHTIQFNAVMFPGRAETVNQVFQAQVLQVGRLLPVTQVVQINRVTHFLLVPVCSVSFTFLSCQVLIIQVHLFRCRWYGKQCLQIDLQLFCRQNFRVNLALDKIIRIMD